MSGVLFFRLTLAGRLWNNFPLLSLQLITIHFTNISSRPGAESRQVPNHLRFQKNTRIILPMNLVVKYFNF